jgi:hypothetical protein
MLARLRTAWRLQRFELIVLIGGCTVLAVAALLVAWQLGGAERALRDCYQTSPDSSVPGWPCRDIDAWFATLSAARQVILGVTAVIPFALGLFLGAPLVAREIERRTAPIAWSLSPSRRSWFGRRTLPVAAIVVLVLLLLGQAAEVLILALADEELGFRNFAMHGPLVAVRGLTVLGIGVLIGLILGRVLPAILLTGLVVIALLGGLQIARTEMMRAEAVWLDQTEMGSSIEMVYDSGIRVDATGEVLTYEQAVERYPDELGRFGEGIVPGTTMLVLANPSEQYPSFVAREAAALLVVFGIATAASLALVGGRRPE